MADVPDGLTLRRHRDLVGRESRPWARWFLLAAVGGLVVAGLGNAFGQRPTTHHVTADVASFKVYSPERLRSGLYYESRFTIEARADIANATIVLDPGWLEGMTLNTLAPGPVGEASRDGRLAFELGHVPAGQRHLFFLHFQVNPTNVGRRSQDVDLYDGDRRLVHVERTVTVFP